MSAERSRIEVRGIAVEVVRKDIKNLHLGVYPPGGRVRVAVPRRISDEAVRMAVVTRLAWIRRKQAELGRQERQSKREFVTGESHYFGGSRYRLDVVERDAPPSVRLLGNRRIQLRVRPGADRDAREAVLYRWYREQLRKRLPALVKKWEPKLGVKVAECRLRRMKTRWGSCNAGARRVWLNSELAKKPAGCLEYVLVHEMAHLLEPRHNERFWAILDEAMPGWRQRNQELNRAPLAHEDWGL